MGWFQVSQVSLDKAGNDIGKHWFGGYVNAKNRDEARLKVKAHNKKKYKGRVVPWEIFSVNHKSYAPWNVIK